MRDRILIAGTGSGCGKTTLACALMSAMVRRGLAVQGFKCGPDYVDPMFHTRITGRHSRNLDPFLLPESTLRLLLRKNAGGADCSVIEGVMGFYDGMNSGTAASTYEVAAITKTPVILVVNARGMSASLAAVVKGFAGFRPDNGIAGVILNGAGERLHSLLKPMLEKETGLEVLGFMPRMEDCAIEERRLGLVAAREIAGFDGLSSRLADQAERSIDVGRVLALASAAPPLPDERPLLAGLTEDPREVPISAWGFQGGQRRPRSGGAGSAPLSFNPLSFNPSYRLAVAFDEAFCFYYRDALDLMEETGAEIVFFSPLADAKLPDAQGLYLGGGYPELHAARLAANTSMLDDIRRRVTGGLPAFAEGGGFMLLCESMRTPDGVFKMSGALKGETFVTERPVRFGYVTMTANRAGLLAPEGWTGRGHEFHYSDGTDNGDGFTVSKPGPQPREGRGQGSSAQECRAQDCSTPGAAWESVRTSASLHAGFPYLHLCGDPRLAVNFARACQSYLSIYSVT